MNIDLEINNYNIDELENLFGLSKQYNTTDIDNKELTLQKKLLNATSITESLRNQIIQFISNAKNKIIVW